ncbi:MAG: hypothetical protein ACXWB9_11595, partial [Flavisolibacter sp.]
MLHGLHKTNTAYNYDSLKNTVTRFYPDLIAVEIRSDDITGDSSYLGKNYPREMWMMRYWFPGVEIDGYDWLGKDLEGRRIPDQYWKNEA